MNIAIFWLFYFCCRVVHTLMPMPWAMMLSSPARHTGRSLSGGHSLWFGSRNICGNPAILKDNSSQDSGPSLSAGTVSESWSRQFLVPLPTGSWCESPGQEVPVHLPGRYLRRESLLPELNPCSDSQLSRLSSYMHVYPRNA